MTALWAEGCGIALRVHSEHDWQEQSDAPIIVSRFPFRGDEFYNSAPRNEKPYSRASPAGRFPVLSSWHLSFLKASTTAADRQRIYLRRQPPPQPSAPKGLSNLRTLGAKAPSILRTLSLPSEPARSVGKAHGSARSARTIEPGRPRRLNPLAFGNTASRHRPPPSAQLQP